MSKIVLKEKLQPIADKFRSVLETTSLIYPETFVDKIDEVYDKGLNDSSVEIQELSDKLEQRLCGADVGGQDYYGEGYNKATSDFWDMFQNYGNRRYYAYAFSRSGSGVLKPKYDVFVDNTYSSGANYMFNGSAITEVDGTIKLRNTNANGVFNLCSSLEKIKVLDVDDTVTFTNTMFIGCEKLTDITVVGTIGSTLNMQSCPLTAKSIRSVIEHLSDNITGQTLTLKQTAVNNAFTDEEWSALEGTKTNWEVSLV